MENKEKVGKRLRMELAWPLDPATAIPSFKAPGRNKINDIIISYTVRPRKNETEKYRCFIIT